jgi:hypothetical protein
LNTRGSPPLQPPGWYAWFPIRARWLPTLPHEPGSHLHPCSFSTRSNVTPKDLDCTVHTNEIHLAAWLRWWGGERQGTKPLATPSGGANSRGLSRSQAGSDLSSQAGRSVRYEESPLPGLVTPLCFAHTSFLCSSNLGSHQELRLQSLSWQRQASRDTVQN